MLCYWCQLEKNEKPTKIQVDGRWISLCYTCFNNPLCNIPALRMKLATETAGLELKDIHKPDLED